MKWGVSKEKPIAIGIDLGTKYSCIGLWLAMNPSKYCFDAKRLIGREFNDPSIQENMKHWPFKFVNDGVKPKNIS